MDNLKDIIKELKEYIKDDICTFEERKIIKKFLNSVKLDLEAKLITSIIEENEDIPSLITNLDNLINEYELSLQGIEDKILLGRINSKIRRLKIIKESVKENNYEKLTDNILNSAFQSEDEVVQDCTNLFVYPFGEFKEIFGKNILDKKANRYEINEDTINTIFNIISNKEVNKQIREYVFLHLKKIKLSKKKNELQNKLDVFKLCVDNFQLVVEYLKTLIRYKKTIAISEPFKVKYDQNTTIIKYIKQGSLLDRITQFYQSEKRIIENDKIGEFICKSLAREKFLDSKIKSLEEEMNKIGLNLLVKEFDSRIIVKENEVTYSLNNYNYSKEAQISEFIFSIYKSSINSKIDVQKYDELIRSQMYLVDERITEIDSQMEINKSQMNEDARILINNNFEDCIKLIKLQISNSRFDVFSVIIVYILETIIKLRNLDYNKINELLDNEYDLDEEKKEYTDFIEKQINKINDEVDEIVKEVKPTIFNM